MPTPGPEHAALAELVGVWDAKMDVLGPTGEWMTSEGVSKRKMHGGFWLVDAFESEVMGMKFSGRGQQGYDPLKKKYVTSWTDTMSPYLSVMEGKFDDAGKVLTQTGKAVGMEGTMVDYRYVTTLLGKNKHTFEMFMPGPDGKMMKSLMITYSRRAKTDKKPAGVDGKRR